MLNNMKRFFQCIGEIATVKDFPNDSTVEVEYKGRSYQFHAGAVRKVNSLHFSLTKRSSFVDDKDVFLVLRDVGLRR